ncbi:MAG: type IV pilus assembly protein PilC [Rhodothermales bacterium]|jgi:type IV pilus assembly protein PilC
MNRFHYSALNGEGKLCDGSLLASSEGDAAAQLREQGLFVTTMRDAPQALTRGSSVKRNRKTTGSKRSFIIGTPKIGHKCLQEFTRQMATLLDAGLPLLRSLLTLKEQPRDDAETIVLEAISAAVEGGSSFADALRSQPKSFSPLYINMVRAGEASGSLDQVLNRLADHMEKAEQIRSRIKAALAYPVAVLTIAMGITAGLMIFIVPRFGRIFSEMLSGEPLPELTQFVMGISHMMIHEAHLILGGFAVLFLGGRLVKRTAWGRRLFDLVTLRMPPFGNLVTKAAVAQFAQTLSTLIRSGVSVLQALDIVRDTSSNRVVADAVQTVHDAVREGETMSAPLRETAVFPAMVVSMVQVGEETGRLPDMLQRIAINYDRAVDNGVDAMTSIIEPVLIVFLAVVVGTIVIALFLPLIHIISTIGV